MKINRMPILTCAILLLLCCGMLSAQNSVEDVKTFTLKNGMKFIVLEDFSIPNANMYTFFDVGSRNERTGLTGVSHFIEHMMFNGGKKYGYKEFDKVLDPAGGDSNALTTEDYTVYQNYFPTHSLEVIFDLEADRIGYLAWDPKVVENERKVVHSERITLMENQPLQVLEEQVRGIGFLGHPYHWSAIGYESDILGWKLDDIKDYFNTYYAPNNAIVVISGAVKFEEVKRLAEKYFAPLPAQTPPPKVAIRNPPQKGEKRMIYNKDFGAPYVMVGYHIPSAKHKDWYALDMLNTFLTTGFSARLNKVMVDQKQAALQVTSYLYSSIDPAMFHIYGPCMDDAAFEKALYEELDKIGKDGITAKELEKIKNNKLTEFYRNIATIDGKSDKLGIYELLFGSYKKMFTYPEDIKTVTAEDIKRVVATYFKKSNRCVCVVKKIEEK